MSLLKPPSALRIAANRRNALKSTGPRTAAGKRRVALNTRSHALIPEELERQLLARGENPRDFRRLHRDLIALFHPEDRAGAGAVLLMASTWWEKARRIRNWVAAGPARVDDLDKRLEEGLQFLVYIQRQRHEWWQQRLVAVLGRPLGGPADVRRKIEARLFLFGAKAGNRKYPRQTPKEQAFEQLLEAVRPILAGAKAEGTSATEAERQGDGDIADCRLVPRLNRGIDACKKEAAATGQMGR
jgi:hypothetical protein